MVLDKERNEVIMQKEMMDYIENNFSNNQERETLKLTYDVFSQMLARKEFRDKPELGSSVDKVLFGEIESLKTLLQLYQHQVLG